MKVLVTGGTGVIGVGVIPELEKRGHQVRLLSRHASEDVAQFREGVEPFTGDVGQPGSITGAADDCDVVLHIAGIAHEEPPEITFQNVNVDGTRNVVHEAERARVPRLIYVSSLGADRGASDYHRSKLAAEGVVREFRGKWSIVRPGNVYGPGDEVLSMLLKMVRTVPVIPIIDDGNQPFQPIWFEDLALVLANLIERPDLDGKTYEVAGHEKTSMNDLIQRFADFTGRKPTRIPVPNQVATIASNVAARLGVDLPVDDQKLTMLQEENVVRDPEGNAIERVFGVRPTSIDVGVRKLADVIPEQLPQDGVGSLEVKEFSTTIKGSPYTIDEVFRLFQVQFAELLPLQTAGEREAPQSVEPGTTLTLSLPYRGNAQVRVVELENHRLTLATVEGHPLAGAVRFEFTREEDDLRFTIRIFDRSATLFDLITMKTVGSVMQNQTWEDVVSRVASLAGGSRGEIARVRRTVEEEEAKQVERWITDLVMSRRRDADGEEIHPRPA